MPATSMSHATAHAAIESLTTRWERAGFVRKGKLHVARTVEHGLHIIAIGGPGSWRTSITVTYAVWLAPFAARISGRPVAWPARRFKLPAEKQWHDHVGHAELAGTERQYVDPIGAVEAVWTHWPAAERWFAERDDYERFAASSIAAGHTTTVAGWQRFQIAALCFLELGQPDRAAEMMEVERSYFHRADVIEGHPHERVLGWWERSATWWRDVAKLRAPTYDGGEGPPVPSARVEPPPRPRPRDSMWYASPVGGEWMKTREPDVALARATELLRFTTFTTWETASLQLHNEAAPTLVEVEARTRASWPVPRSFTAAELAEVGLALDPILADAIARFGPVQFRRWASGYRDTWDTWRSYFFWERTATMTPEDWRGFCFAHASVVIGERRPRVELQLAARGLALRARPDGPLLPHQGAEHYPPADHGPSWPTDSALTLYLPECRMTLRARLPFTADDASFRAYLAALGKAAGYPLSRTHLRALIINQQGTRAYDRKLPPRAEAKRTST